MQKDSLPSNVSIPPLMFSQLHPADTRSRTSTSPRIMSHPKAGVTSDLRGQGRHTLGDKWSSGAIVHTAPPAHLLTS